MSIARKLLMSSGGKKDSTFVDDVFSTYLYRGNGSDNRVVTNNIDLAGEGGLVWVKNRDNTTANYLTDTVRGVSKGIRSNNSNAETTSTVDALKSFTSTGFTVGTGGNVNETNADLASWTFRKAPGFFDVVTYTGTGSNQTINHNLGCVPGLILTKRIDSHGDWIVFHRSLGATKALRLDATDGSSTSSSRWNNTEPTASTFTLGSYTAHNSSGSTNIAYLFAGGASTAATARSVEFDGSNDYLSIPDNDDFDLGTSFTIEAWIYPDPGTIQSGYYGMICSQRNPDWYIAIRGDGPDHMQYYDGNSAHQSAANSIKEGQWTHVAFVNNNGTPTWYINGVASTDGSSNPAPNVPNSSGPFDIGRRSDGYYFNGKISNFRLVKGTAVYTSSFTPTTNPLTDITNTKLLCCNNSSTTGSTVTPGTITNYGSTASTDSPFDDPEGFQFGEEGDQNIIKCGSYIGNGSSDGPDVYLGWEPQWLLIKLESSASYNWYMLDSMRGVVAGGDDKPFKPNTTAAEETWNPLEFTSTGFKLTHGSTNAVNGSSQNYVYMAIRRPDGYVGKPPELGTDVFAMDTGNSSSSGPAFDANFAVDFALNREFAGGDSWATTTRLTGRRYVRTNSADKEENPHSYYYDDYNNGWAISMPSNYQSWMWKRHAGMDVVTYLGQEFQGRQIPHSLNAVPEMIWVKNRTNVTENWAVYHKGANGGTNPEQYYLTLNTTGQNIDNTFWYDTAPTSTHFSVGFTHPQTNQDGKEYLAYLFASVDGISKCGYYDGTGSAGHVITTGFTPRFLIIKTTNAANGWFTYDSLRGLGSGADPYLQLQANNAQDTSGADVFATSSTGFTINQNYSSVNASGQKYIYYAHA